MTTLPTTRYTLRGGCRAAFGATEHELVLCGPRDTGKTVAMCLKVHAICANVPGAQVGMVRKTYAAMRGTVLQTFERVVAGTGVRKVGGDSPSLYRYPNKSAVWVGGLDNPQKSLSAERDCIYVNQCEEVTESDWEILAGACSGRNAVVAAPQLFGDCNPAGSQHWIRRRAKEGKLRLLDAVHKDNPTLYDEAGALLTGPDVAKRLAVLDAMTGVRYKRLRLGLWATAEGAVYDTFDPAVHVLERSGAEMVRWLLAMDEGYTNPAVILLIGEDSDGRWHCFRELYRSGLLQTAVVGVASRWAADPLRAAHEIGRDPLEAWVQPTRGRIEADTVAVDASAAGLIADLQAAGLPARGGKGRVLDGVQKVQDRLKVQPDGKPRYTLDPRCAEHQNEFESYVWQPDKPKDTPVKASDHSMDALRYLADAESQPTGALGAGDFYTGSTAGGLREADRLPPATRLRKGDY